MRAYQGNQVGRIGGGDRGTERLWRLMQNVHSCHPLQFTRSAFPRPVSVPSLFARLIVVGVLAAAVTTAVARGYRQVSTTADVYVWLNDYGLADQHQSYGRVANASLDFQDPNGRTLAQARSTDGVVLFWHPVVGDCMQTRVQGPPEWRRCYEEHSRWYMSWARAVTQAKVDLGNCTIERVPVTREEYRGRWWLWWVPLPHMDNSARTFFSLHLSINSRRDCAPPA